MTERDQWMAANTVLCAVLVAGYLGYLGYLGYTAWRDREARIAARDFRDLIARRQEEIRERLGDAHPKADIVIVPESVTPATD
jgi:hypothetical protein